ncbi:PREDICTED: histone-lysine N-methyltransferase SETMAR-like [Dinoponera quadriceps]|uniref:Histone-lysine N-methyltransferase SETMAR-like n=1 Tax=Dinoponera quadriceps TaxID=609295 RepID=A0A6P3WUX5_DINQU|nr:PREDICTED: histone-lysine N-methyltransferase SETMAR-like [Dinoponera quadriceps]
MKNEFFSIIASVRHNGWIKMKCRSTVRNRIFAKKDEIMRKLTIKPKLVDKDKPILLQDNVQTHVTTTLLKLQEMDLEILCHAPYSPDFAPIDYHLTTMTSSHWTTSCKEKYSILNKLWKTPFAISLPLALQTSSV